MTKEQISNIEYDSKLWKKHVLVKDAMKSEENNLLKSIPKLNREFQLTVEFYIQSTNALRGQVKSMIHFTTGLDFGKMVTVFQHCVLQEEDTVRP